MDYTALTNKYSLRNIKNSDKAGYNFAKDAIKKDYPTYATITLKILYFGLLLYFIYLVFLGILKYHQLNNSWSLVLGKNVFYLVVISLLVLVAFIYITSLNKKIVKTYKFYKFALKNKLIYIYSQKLSEIVALQPVYLPDQGVVYKAGRNKKFTDLVGNANLSLGNFYFKTGYGRSARDNRWIVGSIKLSRNLPHIILDAKSNNNFGFSNLPEAFKSNQITNAEPILIDNFNLYAPTEYKIDSLSFIAPDVIDKLVQYFKYYDLEIIDNTLYVYRMGVLKNEEYQEIFTNMQKLATAIEDNVDTYIDTRVAQGSGILKGLDSIAPQGRRLVASHRNQIIVAIVIIIIILIQVISSYLDSNP